MVVSAGTSDGSGSKNFDPGRVQSIFFVARVRFGFEFQKFPLKNVKFFNFFPFVSKKIASGRVGKYPGRSQVSLLFTAGQK